MSDYPVIAIPDIHGQLDLLNQAFDWIAKDEVANAPLVFLGDYVDRGPKCKEVIDLLIDLTARRDDVTCLMGNHDSLMLTFPGDPFFIHPIIERPLRWLDQPLGGRATLKSYGVDVSEERSFEDIAADTKEAVPAAHWAFLKGLVRMHETEKHVFVHAGIRPGVPLDQQDPEEVYWIRAGFLDDETIHPKMVVHGHTVVDFPTRYVNRINCDAGAAKGRWIHPVVIEGDDAFALGPNGRLKL